MSKTSGKGRPKESRHPSTFALEKVVRRIAQTGEEATGGRYEDKLRLVFSLQDERLQDAVNTVVRSHHGKRRAVRETMERALTGKDLRTKREARIIISTIIKD